MKFFNMSTDKVPTIIQNPFAKSKIICISMYAMKSNFSDKFNYTGSVEFKNGGTEGKQKIEGTSMDDLYIKVAAFVKTLE